MGNWEQKMETFNKSLEVENQLEKNVQRIGNHNREQGIGNNMTREWTTVMLQILKKTGNQNSKKMGTEDMRPCKLKRTVFLWLWPLNMDTLTDLSSWESERAKLAVLPSSQQPPLELGDKLQWVSRKWNVQWSYTRSSPWLQVAILGLFYMSYVHWIRIDFLLLFRALIVVSILMMQPSKLKLRCFGRLLSLHHSFHILLFFFRPNHWYISWI